MHFSKRLLYSVEGYQLTKSYVARSVFEAPPFRLDDIIKASKLPNAISLAFGEPDQATPSHIINAAVEALKKGFTHYTAEKGDIHLREAISRKLKRENVMEVDPHSEILVTCGSGQAVDFALRATLNPREEVLTPSPGYFAYQYCLRFMGARAVWYPVLEDNEFKPRPDDIEDRVTSRTRMVILNSPSNPTGAVLDKETLRGIAEIAVDRDLIVLSDEIYEKLVYDGERHHSIASFPEMADRTITINGFSKAYAMTGWRVGYAVARREIIEAVSKIQANTCVCASAASQIAALAALTGPQKCVESMLKEYSIRRDLLVNRLNAIEGFSCRKPKGAFYVFPNITALGVRSKEAFGLLAEKARVVTMPGSFFGDLGEGYLRISYANSYVNIAKALNRIEGLHLKKKRASRLITR